MASKSSTKRKSAPKKKSVSADVVIEKARSLLETERDTFIVTKISDSQYKVGNFLVTEDNGCWCVNNKKFNFRINAVAYCALVHVGYGNNANTVFDLDSKVSRLLNEKLLFEQRLVNSIRVKDDWKMQVYSARYADVKAHLSKHQIELQKTLNLAKYIKLWSDQ